MAEEINNGKTRYRVYQNRTEFATFVYANSGDEAEEIAEKKQEGWDRYEPTAENIFYEAIPFDVGQVVRKQTAEQKLTAFLAKAVGYVNDYLTEWQKSRPDNYYASTKAFEIKEFLDEIRKYGNSKLTKAITPNAKE